MELKRKCSRMQRGLLVSNRKN